MSLMSNTETKKYSYWWDYTPDEDIAIYTDCPHADDDGYGGKILKLTCKDETEAESIVRKLYNDELDVIDYINEIQELYVSTNALYDPSLTTATSNSTITTYDDLNWVMIRQ